MFLNNDFIHKSCTDKKNLSSQFLLACYSVNIMTPTMLRKSNKCLQLIIKLAGTGI